MGKEELGAKSKTNLNLPLKADREWRSVRLRHVVKMNPSKSEIKNLSPELFVSFLPMDNIGDDGSLRLDTTKSISEVITGYTYFQNGDVTVAKITPCFENGKGALMQDLENGIGFGTTELIVVRPNSDFIKARFLQWLFRSAHFRKMGEAAMFGAGGQKRVPDDFVRNFLVVLPSLPEQRAIAAFLDAETSKIDALVAEQRRLIELLKEKRQAVISHAVTKGLNPHVKMKPSGIDWLGDVPEHWEIARLGRCGVLQNGLSIDGEAFGSGFPFISYSDVYQNEILPELPRGLVRTTEKDQERYDVAVGDVFFTRTSETVDDIGVASTCLASIPRATFAGFLIRFRPTANTLWPNYSTYLFRNEGVKRHFAGTMNLVTRASLSQGVLKALPICFPPRDEQRDIARYLDDRANALLHLISQAQKAIALLQERRTALISAAVTGKIDVRDFVPKGATA